MAQIGIEANLTWVAVEPEHEETKPVVTEPEETEPVATDAVLEPQDDSTSGEDQGNAAPEITEAPDETKPGSNGGVISIVCLILLAATGGTIGFIFMKKRRG